LGEEDMAKVSQGIQTNYVFWKIGSHMNDKMVQNEIRRKTIEHIENGYAATRTNSYNTRVPILNLHKKHTLKH
jgi:hypothetical protein